MTNLPVHPPPSCARANGRCWVLERELPDRAPGPLARVTAGAEPRPQPPWRTVTARMSLGRCHVPTAAGLRETSLQGAGYLTSDLTTRCRPTNYSEAPRA